MYQSMLITHVMASSSSSVILLMLLLRYVRCSGGGGAKDQMRELNSGTHIVTGTPGRVDDLVSTGVLDLSQASLSVSCRQRYL